LRPHAEYLLRGSTLSPARKGWSSATATGGAPVLFLVDGPDRSPGAKQFEWPSADAYGKLTRNHYRVVTVVPRASRELFEAVSGVHAEERDESGRSWRWLGPEAVVRLHDLGLGVARIRLTLDPVSPYRNVRATAEVSDRAMAVGDVAIGAETVLEVPLAGGGPTRVTLRSSRSFVPAEQGLNRDRRRLAVQLVGVEQVGR
jgi:hypothetical protein